jgi:hypothetical protein
MPQISLEPDESLVLFEFLSRHSGAGRLQPSEPGEREALDNLLAALEKTLVEPFRSDYKRRVEEARARLARPK